MRAIEKIADFLLLEGDDDDGGNSGPLGWADASCLAPTSFPAFYELASDLPEGVKLLFVVLRVTKTTVLCCFRSLLHELARDVL